MKILKQKFIVSWRYGTPHIYDKPVLTGTLSLGISNYRFQLLLRCSSNLKVRGDYTQSIDEGGSRAGRSNRPAGGHRRVLAWGRNI